MKSVIAKIEKLFEHEDPYDAFNFSQNTKFQIEPQHQLLEQISFSSGQHQWDIFFSRLTVFFEIGMLIEKSEIQKMFFYGQNIEKKLPRIHFHLPKSPFFNILKTRAPLILKKIGLYHINDSDKMVCLLIRIEDHRYIVLMTKQAEPWLQLRCESLKKALTNHDYFIIDQQKTLT